MSTRRKFYIQRHSPPEAFKLTLRELKESFLFLYGKLKEGQCLDEAFGDYCPDDHQEDHGIVGPNPPAYFRTKYNLRIPWPIDENIAEYDEPLLFTAIELVHELVAEPNQGRFHNYGGCMRTHYSTFDRSLGRERWREEINPILADYGDGYVLDEKGRVNAIGASGVRQLLRAPLPVTGAREQVDAKVEHAVELFYRATSSPADRHHAVRDLVDVLEYLRPHIKTWMPADEGDLFNIANNFGLRHNNPKQKVKYDQAIWFNWMFHLNLATIHAILRVLDRQQVKLTAPMRPLPPVPPPQSKTKPN